MSNCSPYSEHQSPIVDAALESSLVWSVNSKDQCNMEFVNTSNDTLTDSLNEGYVTAEEENSTRYLSVLESSNDITLEDLNVTLSNAKIEPDEQETEEIGTNAVEEELNTVYINGQQVVIFTVEGRDELYGLQLVQNENGVLEKYQFQLKATDDGQLEAMPETIQLLSNDDDNPIVESDHNFDEVTLQEQDEDNSVTITREFADETSVSELPEDAHISLTYESQSIQDLQQVEETDVTETKSEIMANLDHIKQEMFISKEDAPSHTEEETEEIINVSNKDEINSNHENTIVFQEEEETISVTRLPDDDAVEDQYNGLYSDEKGHVEADQVAQEVLPRYEEIFVQETPPLEDNTNNEQIVGYINHNIEDNNEENENHNGVIDYDNCEESDNDDYQIVEGLHITGDVEEENVIQTQEITHVHTDEQSLLKKDYFANSLNEAAINKDTKAVLFYVVRHPEKENLDSMSVLNSSLCKPLKTNPRSILKSSHMASQLPEEQTVQSERLGKRFARSKEAIEERLFMNFINKTTIPVEPIRNHRLPRKQKINPVKRMDDEEIIVQEVVVSSNGFVETLEDGVLKSKEPLKVTEVVTLTDSDDEYDPKQGKKKRRKHKRQKQKIPNDNSDSDDNSVIEILSDSDREVIEPTEGSASVSKRPRGRPKKVHIKTYKDDVKNNEIDTSPTLKRGRPRGFKILSKTQQSDSQDDSESPAKKSRTDDSEDSPKREVTCPDCLKSFASPNSLKTHLQHHSLENCLKNSEVEKTSEPEPDKINPVSNSTHSEAEVNSMLGENTDDNLEKDVENKESESLEESVDGIASVKGSPNADSKPPVVSSDPDSAESKTPTTLQKTKSKPGRSKLSVATRMSVNTKRFSRSTFDYKHKCTDCGAAFKNIILLNRHVCPKKPDSNKFECSICKKGFPDVNKLTTHKRSHIKDNIVKATNAVKVSPKRTRASVAVSTFKSPKKCSSHKCKDCGKICSSIILLNAHMKTHKQFTCTNCNVSFPSRILLDTHVRESCVKTKLPQSRRLSFKIKKAFSPSRTSARFSTKASNSRSSNASDLSDKPNTSIASASKTLQLQCDSCHMKFSSHAKLFDHKVLQHGLNTPDKKSILDRSRRKTLYRQRGTFGGVPASKKLTTAYAALKSKFDDLG